MSRVTSGGAGAGPEIQAVAEVFGMAVVVVGAVLGGLRWRARHADDLRAVLFEMRDFLQGIVATGGATPGEFMDEQRRRDEQRLEDLEGRLISPALRKGAGEILKAYRHTSRLAPPDPGPPISWGAEQRLAKDEGYQARRAETAEAARATLDSIGATMTVIARVERLAIGK